MEELAQIAATPQQIQLVIDPCIVLTQQQAFVHQVPVSKPAVKKQLSSFLTRFHAGYFRISLSLAGQALLWKILGQLTSEARALKFVPRFFPYAAFLLVWYLALVVQVALSFLYALKCLFHFNLVRAEFLHHVGVNYLYTPWISWLLLLQSAPGIGPESNCYQALWWVFAIPIGVLDIKIYGQWFTTDKRFLSVVANPTSQISVIGNLVGAGAAAQMGWIEIAVCMFSLGMVHYLVLFVTLYQHLSGVNRLPAMLRPVFSLFFAAPSMASLAWSSISGAFDTSSKMLFFLSLFLFTSSFPLTFLALASAAYAQESKGGVAPALMLVLSALSILVLLGLMILTAIKTNRLLLAEHNPQFVMRTLTCRKGSVLTFHDDKGY